MTLLKFLLISSLALDVSARRTKGYKEQKGKSSKNPAGCDFPLYLTEPSSTDIGVPNDDNATSYVWEDNDLCEGHLDSYDADCVPRGSASGVCTILASGDTCDSVDTWYINGPDGELLGTLATRGLAYKDDTPSIVVGGTGCFVNAKGTVGSAVFDDEDGNEWWQYDLTNLEIA